MLLTELLPDEVWRFFLVFLRLGAIGVVLPGLAQNSVPVTARLGLVLALTYVIHTALPGPALVAIPASIVELMVIAIAEILIGIGLGLVIRIAFLTMYVLGSVVGFSTGLSNALLFSPLQSEQSLLTGLFLFQLGLVLFFVSDLHLVAIRALVYSYDSLPIAHFDTGGFASLITSSVAQSFAVGLQMSVPLLLTSMMFYLVLGIASRLTPQIQVFFVGLPLQVLLSFFVLMASMSAIGLVYLKYLEQRILLLGG